MSGPDIVSRGFVYVKESEELMKRAREISSAAIERALGKRGCDYTYLKTVIRDDLAKFIYKETKRKPMILPVIMDL
jgi:ribonuclease J